MRSIRPTANHLEIFEREWTTSKFAGICQDRGDSTGWRIRMQFNYPTDVVRFSNRILYVADLRNKKIKKIDLATDDVTIAHTSGCLIDSLVMGPNAEEFYFTCYRIIFHMKNQIKTRIVELPLSSYSRYKYGFGSLSWFNNHTLIIADQREDRIHFLNLDLGQSTSVCSGKDFYFLFEPLDG